MAILSGGRRLRHVVQALSLIGLMMMAPARFSGQDEDEYAVKAVYIFNFSKFAEWPEASGSSTFAICILGDNPFDNAIGKLTRGKYADGRSVEVRRIKEPVDAKACQIAFVSSAENVKAVTLIDAVRGMPVLTVGETEEFLRKGGIIALTMDGSLVNIVINAKAAQNANLKVSTKLLKIAKIYKSK